MLTNIYGAKYCGKRMCVCWPNTCLILPFNFERKPYGKASPAVFILNVVRCCCRCFRRRGAWVASVHSFAQKCCWPAGRVVVGAVYPQKVYRSLLGVGFPPAVVVIVFGVGRTGKIVPLNIHSDLGEIYTLIAHATRLKCPS